jgi:hypothetical protein
MTDLARDFYSDFEVVANTGGADFYVVTDKATHFTLGIENPVPTIMGSFADVGALSVGDAITVAGVAYTVARPPQSDGEQFLTTVVLKGA